MGRLQGKPRVLAGLAVLALLAGAYAVATAALRQQVVQALGPDAEIGRVGVGLRGVIVENLRLPGGRGWPAADALRAARVTVTPDLRALFTDQLRIARISIDEPYLSIVRTRDARLRLVPSLLERPRAGGRPRSALALAIGRIALAAGRVDFFDESLRSPPLRVRLDAVEAQLDDVELPGLAARSPLHFAAILRGVHGDGTVAIDGHVVLATRESTLTTRLRSVDLAALEPYLIKSSETGVRRGTLDLDLDAQVRARQLHAPGHLVLAGLELAPAPGAWSTFMGMPRQAVIASLKNRDHRIALDFTLDGDLDNPRFSLNEALAVRVAVGLAQGLGLSLVGVVDSVGTLGQKGIQGLGSLLGKERKDD